MSIRITWKVLVIMLLDTLLMGGSYALAMLVRFDFQLSQMPMEFVGGLAPCFLIQLVITAVVFVCRRIYHNIWRTVNAHDVI